MAISAPLVQAWRWLNRPLFGTKVIPADATVPEADFPDDEFPVFCPQCDYLLRGLSAQRCPECGHPYDRGRLLVTQYARERDHRLWDHGRLGKWARRLAVLVLAYFAIWVAATHVVAWWGPSIPYVSLRPTARQVDDWVGLLATLHHLMWWFQLFALLALLACVAVLIRVARRNAQKRRRVIDAIC